MLWSMLCIGQKQFKVNRLEMFGAVQLKISEGDGEGQWATLEH